MKLVINRKIKSGLMGGKKFEIAARVDTERDLNALFKGYPDELVMAFKSAFTDKAYSLKRGELVNGTRFSVTSLNEVIEIEDRLLGAVEQLQRMVEIIGGVDAGLGIEE